MSTYESVSSAQCAHNLAAINSTWPSSGNDPTPSPSGSYSIPAVSSPPSLGFHARDGTDLAQLESWLTLQGFRTDVDLPAAFEVDVLQQGQRVQVQSSVDSSTSARTPPELNTIAYDDPETAAHNHGCPPRPYSRFGDRPRTSTSKQQYVYGLRRDIFQRLVESMRQMLMDSSKSDSKVGSRSYREKAWDDCHAESVYTLQDVDLEHVIARVVRVLEAFHHASILCIRDPDRQNGLAEGESIWGSKAILPQALKEADTATTITVPQTYITPMGWEECPVPPNEQPPKHGETKTTATLVSHSSVTTTTEISWTTSNRAASVPDIDGHTAAPHVSSELCSPDVGYAVDTTDAGGQKREIRASVESVSFHPRDVHSSRRASMADTASRAHVGSYPPAKPSAGSSSSSIVSFPALHIRHCTNDWLSPPPTTPAAMGRSEANLYNVGIDARTGPNGFFASLPRAERAVPTPGVCTDDFHFTFPVFTDRNNPAAPPPDDHSSHKQKLGASIGTSAGRKRNSHCAAPADTEAGSSSMLRKLRHGSVQLGHALASVVRGAAQAQQPQRAEQRRRVSSVDQMKAILDRTSQQHRPADTVGHLRARMVSGGDVGHRTCNTCSEDGRPHVCMDDAASSVGSP